MLSLAREVSKYATAPYKDEKSQITRFGVTVYRPNHGICHVMRVGMLANSIYHMCLATKISDITNYILTNNILLHDVQTLATFQRTGRESEIASTQNPYLYRQYEKKDVEYFEKWTGNTEMSKWLYQCSTNPISRLIKTAHMLDLRRIPYFDEKRIKRSVSELLFVTAHPNPLQKKLIEELWVRSGELIRATGDRMMPNKKTYDDKFIVLSTNIELLCCILNDI